MSLFYREFITYLSYSVIAIVTWSKYCQSPFPNGETKAQKELITKRWEQMRTLTWWRMSHPSPCLLLPCWLSGCLCTGRESPFVCLAHAGLRGGWTPSSLPLSDSEAWDSPKEEVGLQANLEIFRNSWKGSYVFLPSCFLSVALGSTPAWLRLPGLGSLRNRRHSYPTEIWKYAGAE